ncbi:hypothetical protein E1A91_D03G160200v1 [Gossypium mustelinum]|uniref:Uncharacterized protein n=1 Tax=Gossypium mustelinum TaxID=34275 RepID=A0A5D2VNZ7_GOSMU|nr:hypothetical protein E1A91_D03G160200v1 [Gossypium mustelinum]
MHFANKAHQVILELVPFPINTNSSLLLSWFLSLLEILIQKHCVLLKRSSNAFQDTW